MSSQPPEVPKAKAATPRQKHACATCSRRKVKCDKLDPCSNCVKAQTPCSYESNGLAQRRPRKRAADEELVAKLARYEALMAKHNVDFSHDANVWVDPVQLQPEPPVKESKSQSPDTTFSTASTALADSQESSDTVFERCLWSTLSSELKFPPIHALKHKDNPYLRAREPFYDVLAVTEPKLYELHPEPRHIFRFWQIFVETVNPFMKIVHVPTMQQRVLDASWDLASASKPLVAIMFAIYHLAVAAVSYDDCLASFGETKDTLMTRYRAATIRALFAADVFNTRDFEVLQAFVLFLLSEPESELSCTLSAAAVRIGEKLGLHRESTDPKVSLFENEMRVRLWWRLWGIDARSKTISTPGLVHTAAHFGLGDLRAPLNVNDADLHPEMTELPPEQEGPTEMICILSKFELARWLRYSPKTAKVFLGILHGVVKDRKATDFEDRAIDELEAIYEKKFIQPSNALIPLHAMAQNTTRLVIAHMRFKVHHPRSKAVVPGREGYIPRHEADLLFAAALSLLEFVDFGLQTRFATNLFTHMSTWSQVDSYVYVISDLRRRVEGPRVAAAWRLVEQLFAQHPEVLTDGSNSFYVALGDLTLEAWEARRQHLVAIGETGAPPHFIQMLWDARQKSGIDPASSVQELHSFAGMGLMDDSFLDWDGWNNFLRF